MLESYLLISSLSSCWWIKSGEFDPVSFCFLEVLVPFPWLPLPKSDSILPSWDWDISFLLQTWGSWLVQTDIIFAPQFCRLSYNSLTVERSPKSAFFLYGSLPALLLPLKLFWLFAFSLLHSYNYSSAINMWKEWRTILTSIALWNMNCRTTQTNSSSVMLSTTLPWLKLLDIWAKQLL